MCHTSFFFFQDIIENEDIKLDNMFITSLVHDLIKVSVFKAEEVKEVLQYRKVILEMTST